MEPTEQEQHRSAIDGGQAIARVSDESWMARLGTAASLTLRPSFFSVTLGVEAGCGSCGSLPWDNSKLQITLQPHSRDFLPGLLSYELLLLELGGLF